MPKYTIGIDFGTLSGRAVLVDTSNGRELASAALDYPHGVMDAALPDGQRLPHDYALQHPQDYLDVLTQTIPQVLAEAGVSKDDVVGIGTDFTACTLIPCKADGTPLCLLPQYQGNRHAYAKLWKHHAAQDKANRLNDIAAERNEPWLARYGGKISSEWAIPKIWEVADEAPELYAQTERFIEASDWIVWQLCGQETRNACAAGYKALWHKGEGYPSADFFKALDPRLETLADEKLSRDILPLGAKAGELTSPMAVRLGLNAGIAVAVGNVDAHVCAPAVGIDGPGKMMAIVGTSTCHMLLGQQEQPVPGICGVVEDGILPGFFGYEAGQSCVGDHFAWFVESCLPAAYRDAAEAEQKNIHAYLREKASALRPGQSGLVALDWWNGNRSVLVDADLSGLMLGMTLQTAPEEIYRALIEATAYGTRMIIDNFTQHGLPVTEFYAAGGIAQKDPMMMQIYADVINRPIKIAGSEQSGALGSAIFGAVAAGRASGGYDSVFEAARAMGKVKDTIYLPNAENALVYDKLYAEYTLLHDYFGRGANDAMKRLKAIRRETGTKR